MERPKLSSSEMAKLVGRHIIENDRFSVSLGIRLLEVEPGECLLEMQTTTDMMNAFGSVQGGATYGLADTAFAIAANSHGTLAVGIETAMSYPGAVKKGETLQAKARELSRRKKLAIYEVILTNPAKETVGIFKGTVFITSNPYPLSADNQ